MTDPGKLDTWQTNTVSAEREDEGPMRVGSRLREVHRAPGGKELPSVVEVDGARTPAGLRIEGGGGQPAASDLDIALEPSRTAAR